MSSPSELFDAGNLTGALQAVIELVKKNPNDTNSRGFFCELLCLDGQWERADKQLETLAQQDSELIVGAGLIRQLIRAETARQQFFQEGRLPEFLSEVSPIMRLHLDASIALRDGDLEKASELLAQAETDRLHPHGTCDGNAFDDWRDLDDLCAPFFEVLTTNGKYYWVPFEAVESIEFRPPKQARDLLWRGAHIVFREGPDGEVFIPARYVDSAMSESDALKMGRMTDWCGEDAAPVRGVGQRMFLAGEKEQAILEIKQLQFAWDATS